MVQKNDSSMKKKRIIIIISVFAVAIMAWFVSQAQSHGTNTPASSSSRFNQRLNELEQAGELPPTASPLDRQVARNTSWWGKPLDPKTFWKNKAIWLDTEARVAAHRHGRQFPPIPFGETQFSSYSENDIADESTASEGESSAYHSNERERAFWFDFVRKHPLPPEDLEQKQVEVEGGLLSSQNWTNFSAVRPNTIKIYQNSLKDDAIKEGFPPEALTDDDTLYWSYVVYQNRKYKNDIQTMPLPTANILAKKTRVDLNLITNSLSTDQIKKANSWKIPNLRRLKGQNVDQSYINAYMQAWNLSSNEVFGASN